MITLAAAVEGWLIARLGWIQRILLLAATACQFTPDYWESAAGTVIAALVLCWNYRDSKKIPAARPAVGLTGREEGSV